MTSSNYAILVISTVLLTVLGIAGVIILQMRHPGSDMLQEAITIFGFITPTIVSLLAAIKSFDNGGDIKELKVQMNGHTEQMRKDVARVATLTERALNASEVFPENITPEGIVIKKSLDEKSI